MATPKHASVAILRDLQTACQADGCRKWAVVELWAPDGRGLLTAHGKFCRECGRRKLAKTQRESV